MKITTSPSRKRFFELEKYMKGVANHRRIEILQLIHKTPGLSTDDIVARLGIHYQTGAAHTQRLVRAGLVDTHRQGSATIHHLSNLGTIIIKLLINI